MSPALDDDAESTCRLFLPSIRLRPHPEGDLESEGEFDDLNQWASTVSSRKGEGCYRIIPPQLELDSAGVSVRMAAIPSPSHRTLGAI